jgi:hypothetical protein
LYIIRKGWNLDYWCDTVPPSAPRAPFPESFPEFDYN